MLDERIREHVEQSAAPVNIEEVLTRSTAARTASWIVPGAALAGLVAVAVTVLVVAVLPGSADQSRIESVAAAPPALVAPDSWMEISDQFTPIAGGDHTKVLDIVEVSDGLVALGAEFTGGTDGDVMESAVGALWFSGDDGATWQRQRTGDVDDSSEPWDGLLFHSVHEVGLRTVLAGFRFDDLELRTVLFVSDDLQRWTVVDLASELDMAAPVVNGMAERNGELFAWASDGLERGGELWTSPDGANWSPVETAGLPASLSKERLDAYNDRLFLLGVSGDMWASDDGTVWSQATIEPSWARSLDPDSEAFVVWLDLLSGPNTHVLLGAVVITAPEDSATAGAAELGEVRVWESEDGIVWEASRGFDWSVVSSASVESHDQGYAFTTGLADDQTLVDIRDGGRSRSKLPVSGPSVLAATDDRWIISGSEPTGELRMFISG